MRVALDAAAPLYRDAPEAREAKEAGTLAFRAFMLQVLPRASDEACVLASDLITTTLSSVGKRFSETPRSPSEIEAYADAMSDMFCAYLRSLGHEEREFDARQS
jgi:Tetracyclin repressor-like, C-terminal domain